MTHSERARALACLVRYLLALALVLALATMSGAAGAALVITGHTPLTSHVAGPAGRPGPPGPRGPAGPTAAQATPALTCVPPGSANAASIYTQYRVYGVPPALAPHCPSGLAVDLDLLRAAMGLP